MSSGVRRPALAQIFELLEDFGDPECHREALEVCLGEIPKDAEFIHQVKLPPKIKRAIKARDELQERLVAIQSEANEANVAAATALVEHGLSVRDAAEVLGVSFQRVHQLTTQD